MTNAEKKNLKSTPLMEQVEKEFPNLSYPAQRIIAIDRYLKRSVLDFKTACLERQYRRELVTTMTRKKKGVA